MLTEFLPSSKTHSFWWGGVGWGNNVHWHLHRYATARSSSTATHTWCYATARSSSTATHTWCYATARSSSTATHTWCYATARSSSTATHTWCYATARSSSTATHMWCYATARSSSTATHTWCYATARSSSTATFIKQLSWFDFGPLQEEKTLRGLLLEKLNPQVRRPLFFSQNWCFAMAKRLVINMWTVKIPPGYLCILFKTAKPIESWQWSIRQSMIMSRTSLSPIFLLRDPCI